MALPENRKTYKEVEASSYGVETINSLDRLRDLREEWNDLAERFNSPLLLHDWFYSCAEAFCPPGRLNVIVVRSKGRMSAIAPLVRHHRFGIDDLELLGTACLMEPTSFLFDSSSSLEYLWDVLLGLETPLILMRLLPEPAMEPILQASIKKRPFFIIERSNSSPWIPITSSWNEFELRMTPKRRSNLRRLRRLLEVEGKVTMEMYTKDSFVYSHALSEAFRIEGSGWKTKQGTSILSNTKLKAFFTTYGSAVAHSGIVRLFLLKVNGMGIAMMLGVEHSRRLWILKVGYDESWARFAPGILLHHESIRWAFEHQLEGYEFLGTTEPWITEWTASVHTYNTYLAFPRSILGLMYLGMEGARILQRKASNLVAKISMVAGSPLCLELTAPATYVL